MKRNIKVIASFEENNFGLFAFEEKVKENILIFSEKHKSNNDVDSFFRNSILNLENFIKGKIRNVFVLFKNAENANLNVLVSSFQTEIFNNNISKKDIDKNLEQFKKTISNSNQTLISIKALEYWITNKQEVIKFLEAPVNKEAQLLKINYSLSFINNEIVNYVKRIFQNLKIKIEEFITSEHLLSFIIDDSEKQEHINVNVLNKYISISYIKENQIIENKIYAINFDNCINQLAKKHNLDSQEIKNFIAIYGKIVINQTKEMDNYFVLGTLKMSECNYLITEFAKFVIKKVKGFLETSNFKKVPIVFHGILNNYENFLAQAQQIIQNFDIKILKIKKSLEFKHQEIVGFINYISYFNQKMVKNKYDTLIETKPHSINILESKTNKISDWINKILFRKEKNVL